MDESLHPRRLEILKVLARFIGDGYTPSTREIASSVGLSGVQTAQYHLAKLESDGYIKRGDAPSRKRRPISLTQRGWDTLGTAPVMGRVAAGRGLEAIVDEDSYSLTRLLDARGGGRRFLLRSVGQSMTGAGIEDGDLLIVEEREDPPDGSIVVAILNNGEEATVKKLYREGTMVRLAARNGSHRDIVVSSESVKITGEVVYVIHQPRD